ncbi:MAG: helix-turn-helix domain-containing protein [Vallitalea sp.]|jgi:transcriptional regulator with XRE-family HTH domain|nr:helix-turn-helix domain-containing protein [Vallitalea sp.]
MRLREIRIEKGLTNKKISELSGVPIRTIEDIIKRGDCKFSTAVKIAKGLNITLEELAKPTD